MKKYGLLFLIFFPALVIGQEKMVKHEINDEISYMVPESFVLMTSGDRIQRFVSAREPLAMHASQDREINFGVNWNPMEWVDGDEETIKGFYKASIQSMFDEVNFLQEEITTINGRTFIVFEFVSTLKSENAFSGTKTSKNYSYIQYTSYNNQVLLFNFGCKARLMNEWKSVANAIMQEVEVTDKK